ncbi:ATP-dependent kinase-like protein notR' [Phragmites australis]|uniref:ATP-dependent kinase-like protein notR' n=1 Tax=Phragmites australis TaxID=29695 RepID=UPI002D77F8FC|nr:ATP-dependent kinase-like protein notR' [Phragmites australis]
MVNPQSTPTLTKYSYFHLCMYNQRNAPICSPLDLFQLAIFTCTFNPSLLLKCLQTLRTEGSVYAPSFDHGVGDPIENDIFVKPQHKIVIVEGNYRLLEEDVWREVRALLDEKWFWYIDIDVSMQRVLKRHIATGKEPDVAAWRIWYNDRPNAELIMESRKNADLVIRSVEFSS